MQYRITKIEKYGKGCYTSEKIGVQYYFVVHTRVFDKSEADGYYRIKFLIMFDGEDICEHCHDENDYSGEFTASDVEDCKIDFAVAAADCICGCNKDIHGVIADANATIERYAA